MGKLTAPREEEIKALFHDRGIPGAETFVVGRRWNSFLKGLLKLLVSNLYYAIDATVLRIIAANDEGLIVINPNLFAGVKNVRSIDEDNIEIIPWEDLECIEVSKNSRTGIVTWKVAGNTSRWVVDLWNPGIWHFNPEHFEKLEKTISQKGQSL